MSLSQRSQWWKLSSIVVVFAVLALSCQIPVASDGKTGGGVPPSQRGSTGVDDGGLRCEQEGYPCSLSEVSAEVMDENKQIMQRAVQDLQNGVSIEEVAQRLRDYDQMQYVKNDEIALSFRLKGSMPMWVYHPEQTGESLGAPSVRGSNPMQQDGEKPDGPAGPQPPGEEPEKQALILAPFTWQVGDVGTTYIAEKIRSHRNYDCEGCVSLEQQTQRPALETNHPLGALERVLSPYSGWEKYEIIQIVTHGGQVCDRVGGGGEANRNTGYVEDGSPSAKLDCDTSINTGRYWSGSLFDALQNMDPEISHALSTPGVALSANGTRPGVGLFGHIILTTDYFRYQYPDGLDDKLIYFTACKSFRDMSLSRALVGENTTFLGWNDNVKVAAAGEISKKLFDYLIDDGLDPYAALVKLGKYQGFQLGFEGAGAMLRGGGSRDIQGREVVTLVHPSTREELEDEDTTVTHGVVKDGQKDTLYIAARIDGIDDEHNPEDFEVHVSLDGEEVPQTFTADPSQQVDEYSYIAQGSVELPFDVTNQESLQLEVWAELPEGGETRHVLEGIKPLGCGWEGEMSGVETGEYQGLIMDYGDVSGTLDSGEISELLGGLGDTSGLIGLGEMASLMGKTWLLTFDGYDRFVGMIAPEMGLSSLPTIDTELLAYNTQNLNYQEGQSAETEISGSFSGSYYGLKMEGTEVTRTEGPTFEGKFTYHDGALCNMEVMMPILEHYGTVGPFGQ